MYFYLGDEDHNRMVGNVLAAILEAHRIERPIQVNLPQGAWLSGLDTAYHTDGKAQYIGLTERRVALDQVGQKLSFRAPRPGHGYDMLEGKYLGQGQEWQTEIVPGGVRLFSVLPYRVERLEVNVQGDRFGRGAEVAGTVRIVTSRGTAERHVVHLDVLRPDGQTVRYLDRNLETRRGRASFSLPLALNEQVGRYTLRFTDVATGTRASAEFDLRP
jgi:hypothetical protein